jgi:hypothetical protein
LKATPAPAYRDRFGTDECWELAALSPTVISDLIRAELERLVEPEWWRNALAQENTAAGCRLRGGELDQGREAPSRAKRQGRAMPPNWRWLIRRRSALAIHQEQPDGTWSITIGADVLGAVMSERGAIELVLRHDRGEGGA